MIQQACLQNLVYMLCFISCEKRIDTFQSLLIANVSTCAVYHFVTLSSQGLCSCGVLVSIVSSET